MQHEIRSQILAPHIRKEAELIKKGEILPEGWYQDEEGNWRQADVLSSWLLQIDPGLDKLQFVEKEEDYIALLQAAVEVSFQNHWRITRELDRLFIDPTTNGRRNYYGIPNERFAVKELMWNANKIAREPERFARRAYTLIPESPVHWSSLSDMMGGDISSMLGVFERSSWYSKGFYNPATDSNVFGGWITDIDKAYEIYVRFARSGKIGNEDVTALMIKPFNDLDKADTLNDFVKAITYPANEINLYNGIRGLLGRAEGLLKAIEAQDNSRGAKGALWIEYADIIYENGKAYIVYYDEKTGKPKTKNINGIEVKERIEISDVSKLKDTASGAHSAYTFYGEYVRYAITHGRDDYEGTAWALWMMGQAYHLKKKPGGFKNFWDWFGTKAIRTYPE